MYVLIEGKNWIICKWVFFSLQVACTFFTFSPFDLQSSFCTLGFSLVKFFACQKMNVYVSTCYVRVFERVTWYLLLFLRRKKTKNMRKKVFFSSRETSHFLFSRVFTITWRSFDSGMYVLSEQQPYILSYGRLKRFTGFELRKENCSIGSALVACVFVYCIFISLDVNLKIFVNFLRRRFHYFVWPLKIFKLKFTISCCWSSRLCISLSHHIRGEVGTFSILLKAFSIRVLFLSV